MRREELLKRRSSDAGTTLLELSLVLLVMSIVLAIAGSVLFSLSQTASRDTAMVTDEQNASTVLSQVSRDIRSAHQVTFAAFGSPVPTQEIELQMNQPAGRWVEWVYTPSAATVNGASQPAHTLARYIGSSATGVFSKSAPSVSTPVNVANGTSIYLFRYFNGNGSEITTQSPSSLQTCTTRITVNLEVATQKTITAVPTFQVNDDVAITDQAAQWRTLPC